MFSQAYVILFTGAGHAWQGHVWQGHVWQGHVWQGHVWQGVCMARGHARGGACVAGGRRDGHCSGRYASYWKTFLCVNLSLMLWNYS